MPQFPAFAQAVAETAGALGLSGAGAQAFVYAVTAAAYVAEAAALAVVADSLAPKTPSPEAQRQTFRQAVPTRRRGCGHARMGGPYLLDFAGGGVLYRVIAMADCPVSNIDEYWLHQDNIRLVGGVVQSLASGAYDSADERVKIATHFGQSGVPSFTDLSSAVGAQWAATASGAGIFMAYMRCVSPKLEYFDHDYPHGNDPQFNLAGDVDVFFDWRDETQHINDQTTWKPSANPVIVLVNELWRHRGYDWNLDFNPSLDILTAEADVCDEPVPILNIIAKIALDVAAGDTHVVLKSIDGLTSGKAIFIAGQAFTVSGAPSAVDDGWQVNLSGAVVAGLPAGEVASWVSDIGSPVTRPRYQVGGLWNADEDEATTVKRPLDAMDGFMTRRGSDNAVIIRAGHYIEPTVTLGADELIDYTWQPFVANAQAINELVPAFVSPAYDYTQVDTTPWQDEDDIDARGLIISQPFAPELVQSNSQVRRLAKAKMSRLRYSVETFKFKASALRALGQRWVRLQAGLDELSDLADVVLEIAGDYEIADNGMSVILTVRKAETNLYDWDYETEEGDGPAAASKPYAGPLPIPTIVSVTPFTDTIAGGVSGTRLTIVADGPDRTDLNWSWRWRIHGTDTWSDFTTNQTEGGAVTIVTGFVPTGGDLDVAVAYMTATGTLSPWSTTETASITSPYINAPDAGLGALASLDTVSTFQIDADAITQSNFDAETTSVACNGTDMQVLSAAVTLTEDAVIFANAALKLDFTSGDEAWSCRLLFDGVENFKVSGGNTQDGIPLIGWTEVTASVGSPVTVTASVTVNASSHVNVKNRLLYFVAQKR